MAKTLCVVNQKGGVGKTTSAVNLAACLANEGYHTVLIDLDPQGNATSGSGVAKADCTYTIYDSIIEHIPLSQILKETQIPKLRVAPANSDLLSAELHLAEEESGRIQLKRVLGEFYWNIKAGEYTDYLIIDCPPSFGQLSINALLCSDSVLIPVQCEYFALEGLTEILKSTTLMRQKYNPYLQLEGILLTMSDNRLNLSRQVEEDIRQAYAAYVFNSIIPRSVRLSEAPSHGLPIILYDGNSKGAKCYIDLAKEVVENETKSPRPWPIRSLV